jgi:CRISPR-associated protein Csm1
LKAVYEAGPADAAAYLAGLLKLMQQYTWCIPSAYYKAQPDISLYDHSRMTAALAACLVELAEAEVTALLQEPAQHRSVALLVGGDISGVQKFIYTITSRGATGGLRGRSMYLSLLTEIVARYTLDRLGLPLTNLIYAGGGHFYLLAPPGGQEKLLAAQQYVSRVLLHHHGGDLYLAVASEMLHADEFQGKDFSERWRGLTQKLQLVKQRQFSELGQEMAGLLFEPQEHGGNEEKLCAVCQREHAEAEKEEPDNPASPTKCPVCWGFEELGNALRQAHYLRLDEAKATPLPDKIAPAGGWQKILAHFGYEVELSESLPPANPQAIRRHLLALTGEALERLEARAGQVVGRHLLVNVTPALTQAEYDQFRRAGLEDLPKRFNPEKPPIKTFEVMAEQSRGIKRLGILRMDVDNLGQMFSQGLGEKATLSRVATLSFAMSLFFEGWVAQIAAGVNDEAAKDDPKRAKLKGLLYSIYSGGDDLFIVGAWDLLPRLAERINQDLAIYTGGHPGIHASGGIALAGSKYPLYQAAEDAHEAEQAAKTSHYNGQSKNALNFLEQTIPWARFEEVKQRQKMLAGLVQAKKAPMALLRRLNQLYAEYAEANRKLARQGQTEKVYWGPWHWHSAYSLGRLADRHKEAREEIKQLRDELSLENFKNIEWVGLAARWAELLERKSEKEY